MARIYCSTQTPKQKAVNADCLLDNECQFMNILYQAKITAIIWNYNPKIYYGTSKETLKMKYGNHKKYFCHEEY